MKTRERKGISACSRVEVGCGITAKGEHILTFTPVARSEGVSLGAFGLLEADAKQLAQLIQSRLAEIERSKNAN